MISQAILDSYSDKRYHRLAVTRWIFNPDFEIVCDLASLHPVTIKKCLAEVLKENGSIRAEVMGKRFITELEHL